MCEKRLEGNSSQFFSVISAEITVDFNCFKIFTNEHVLTLEKKTAFKIPLKHLNIL